VAGIERIAPPGVHRATGWTHVVKATRATQVHVSGQTGRAQGGSYVNGLEKQAEQAYENLRLALAAAGASPRDVVKEVILIVDFTPEKGQLVWPARAKLWGREYPASTLIGVQALGGPEALIEIEAIAALD
jgi:enamine deaminase RidA (YjgF/YER057c/UK114 family)